jgi:hypothetical protein
MKKATFGLILLLVLGFVLTGCVTTGTNEGMYDGTGVWLVSKLDFTAWKDGSPKPAAIGILPDNIEA